MDRLETLGHVVDVGSRVLRRRAPSNAWLFIESSRRPAVRRLTGTAAIGTCSGSSPLLREAAQQHSLAQHTMMVLTVPPTRAPAMFQLDPAAV